jgi:hypothetical protein
MPGSKSVALEDRPIASTVLYVEGVFLLALSVAPKEKRIDERNIKVIKKN